jgi:acyl-CoA reductase-like NAD-dependent aldehyde dehydrogenase
MLPAKVRKLRVRYRPYPVVGIISPWNFPLILSAGDGIPALMAGAAVVIKPSEFTPLELMEVIRGWKEEVGGPDIIDYVNGTGDTGGALIDNVDYMHFTGSDRTGRIVMKRAADTLTPVSLELGGKDPAIVLADADMDRAVNACAYGGFVNTGQVCMSIERIYVEEPVYDVFVNRLADSVRELRQGADGRSYEAEQGAMTSPAQIDIVSDHVEDARSKGARILTGGKRKDGPGDWYEPTVVADADHTMKVMRDETFGPVVGVMKVKDADEAVRMANDTRYGLSASVFSKDVGRAEQVAEQLEVGAANINDALVNYFHLEVPMGGWKDSGIGWRHGPGGIRKYCRTETIVSPRLPNSKSEPLWYPYTPGRRKLLNRLYRMINARGFKNRLGL